MRKRVIIGGTLILGTLPVWCLILAILLGGYVVPMGIAGFVMLFMPYVRALGIGYFCSALVLLPLVILLLRGWLKRGCVVVKFCPGCGLPLQYYDHQCSQCGGLAVKLSVNEVRRLLEEVAILAGRVPASGRGEREVEEDKVTSAAIQGRQVLDTFGKETANEDGRRLAHSRVGTEAARVFISYVEEDGAIASEIAQKLEERAYNIWYYERDSIPGESYLTQVGEAIDKAAVVLLIISPASIRSQQVTNEIIRAYEGGKPFLPLLHNVTHAEFQRSQPQWRQVLGAATSIPIPPDGIAPVLRRIVAGIEKTSRIQPRHK